MKASLQVRSLRKDLVLADFERRVEAALDHYALHQPHSALDGATPAEVLLRLPPACQSAIHPPRGRPGQVLPFPTFRVAHLAPGFPVLARAAA